jgi:phage tail-like protein
MTAHYPPVGFHFKVEFGFLPQDSMDARFQEVGGLTSELGVEEVVEGGENRFAHRLPIRAKFGNLVLRRGLLTDSQLIDWCKNAIENFSFEPATVNVTLLNKAHQPLAAYSFIKAWPLKWSVSNFKAAENAIVVETLELGYNYFSRIKL